MKITLALAAILIIAAGVGGYLGVNALSDDAPVARAVDDDFEGSRYVYTVKYICEEVFFDGGFIMLTDINVHNPNHDVVKFAKKGIAIGSIFGGETGSEVTGGGAGQTPAPTPDFSAKDLAEPGPLVSQELPANWATGLDCGDIGDLIEGRKEVGERFAEDGAAGLGPNGEGVVVFESDEPLDVWAVYTVFSGEILIGGQGEGAGPNGFFNFAQEIEQVKPTRFAEE